MKIGSIIVIVIAGIVFLASLIVWFIIINSEPEYPDDEFSDVWTGEKNSTK